MEAKCSSCRGGSSAPIRPPTPIEIASRLVLTTSFAARMAFTRFSQESRERIFGPDNIRPPAHRCSLPGAGVAPVDCPPIRAYEAIVAAILAACVPPDHGDSPAFMPEFKLGFDALTGWMKPVTVPHAPRIARRPNPAPASDFLDFPRVAQDIAVRSGRSTIDAVLPWRDDVRRKHDSRRTRLRGYCGRQKKRWCRHYALTQNEPHGCK